MPTDDRGFTLVEVMVTIALAGVLMAMAVSGWSSWARSSAQEGAATEIQGVLRQAQQRAVSEGGATCVQFSTATDSWTVLRGGCADTGRSVIEGPVPLDSDQVHLTTAAFSTGTGSSAGVTFSSRGTATPGTVTVGRDGSGRIGTIRVDGLTGRVTAR